MSVDLAVIHNHLEQGYFLKEDMETLGLNGNVSIATMREELANLFQPAKPSKAQLDAESAQAGIEREKASQAKAQSEAQDALYRAALVASIQAKQPNPTQQFTEQQAIQNALDRFNEALKHDTHVSKTTEVLGTQDQTAS